MGRKHVARPLKIFKVKNGECYVEDGGSTYLSTTLWKILPDNKPYYVFSALQQGLQGIYYLVPNRKVLMANYYSTSVHG
jgi:hypothetical protein